MTKASNLLYKDIKNRIEFIGSEEEKKDSSEINSVFTIEIPKIRLMTEEGEGVESLFTRFDKALFIASTLLYEVLNRRGMSNDSINGVGNFASGSVAISGIFLSTLFIEYGGKFGVIAGSTLLPAAVAVGGMGYCLTNLAVDEKRRDKYRQGQMPDIEPSLVVQLFSENTIISPEDFLGKVHEEVINCSTEEFVAMFNEYCIEWKENKTESSLGRAYTKGINYGSQFGPPIPPQTNIPQYIFLAWCIRLIETSEFNFPNVDLEKLRIIYSNFQQDFTDSCKEKYGLQWTEKNIEQLLNPAAHHFLKHGEVDLEILRCQGLEMKERENENAAIFDEEKGGSNQPNSSISALNSQALQTPSAEIQMNA